MRYKEMEGYAVQECCHILWRHVSLLLLFVSLFLMVTKMLHHRPRCPCVLIPARQHFRHLFIHFYNFCNFSKLLFNALRTYFWTLIKIVVFACTINFWNITSRFSSDIWRCLCFKLVLNHNSDSRGCAQHFFQISLVVVFLSGSGNKFHPHTKV